MFSAAVSFPAKELYNPRAFFTHAASLDQGCPHCPRFPTAASRRSPGRVSVPVWLIILSDQLPIAGLAGRYPANNLIGHGPLRRREAGEPVPRFAPWRSCGINPGFPGLFRTFGHVPMRYSPVRRSPPGPKPRAAARLACIRRAASVQSEPGSNSSVFSLKFGVPALGMVAAPAGNAKHCGGRCHSRAPGVFRLSPGPAPAYDGCLLVFSKTVKERGLFSGGKHSPNAAQAGKRIIQFFSGEICTFLDFFFTSAAAPLT